MTNVAATLLNGNTIPIADNIGNLSTFTDAPNLSGGQSTIGFAATGQTITITGAATLGAGTDFDFFIDNLSFNAPLPDDIIDPDVEIIVGQPGVVPLRAGGLLLLLSAFVAFGAMSRRRARLTTTPR